MAFTTRDFRNAMGCFPTGVVIISCLFEGKPHAMTANAFMSGSLEPPLVVISVDKNAASHARIKQGGRFAVSMLTQAQLATSNHFAGRQTEGFEPDFEWIADYPVIKDATVQVICDLAHDYDCGDHTLFIGKVTVLHTAEHEAKPLMFHCGQYVQLGEQIK